MLNPMVLEVALAMSLLYYGGVHAHKAIHFVVHKTAQGIHKVLHPHQKVTESAPNGSPEDS